MGALVIINGIWPIYNVLKNPNKTNKYFNRNHLLLSGIAKKIKLNNEAATKICVYQIRFGFLLSKYAR